MDNSRPNNIHELFSRAPTPPPHQQQHQHFSAPSSHISNSSSPNQIDALFHHITSPSDQQQQLPQNQNQNQNQHIQHPSGDSFAASAPVSPLMPFTNEPAHSGTSAASSNATPGERQSALLSLLSSPPSNLNPRPAPAPNPLPQQVPTPPGSQRSNASPTHNETQGKILLEQLMAGNPPRSSYPDAQRVSQPPNAPSPPYPSSQRESEYQPYNQYEQPIELASKPQPTQPAPVQQQQPQQSQQLSQQQQQQQQQPPSPRRSMFEYMTPFDHLSASTGAVKKKPVPAQPPSVSSSGEDSSWTTVPDPKRQSVENLLEHLTRGQPPAPPLQPSSYDPYVGSNDYGHIEQVQQRAQPPPLPPKPANRAPSPRASPPKPQAQVQRTQVRPIDSPASQTGVPLGFQQPIGGGGGTSRRDKESSPARGGPKAKAGTVGQKFNSKAQSSPSPQSQTIIFDVSSAHEEVQAPRDSVKSTAIALVKQESVFLPGTTIGATHWVAYAMTRGRVRVISRSSGDRTLLQLPPCFPVSSSVTDMAVYHNSLAGVTSDGGFVVWQLPEVIMDDVPGDLLLCVPPTSGPDALHSVKWHPKDPDTLAVASDNKICVIDLENTRALHGEQPLPHSDLHHIGQIYNVLSPVVAFDFDVLRYALATISEDSTLTIWNIQDRLPYATHKVRGEDTPSSLTFVDGGLVVGRRKGTIFQLLSMTTKAVLSTVKFVNGNQEDPDMFGHVSYDSRIQTLWVANNRRDSMIAFKINLEPYFVGGEESVRGYFDQVAEFAGPKPTIHFVILSADADPHGDEAHAACVAAKVPPGELALVAFSVHSSGVDQILIRKEWFDSALATAPSKFPAYALPQAVLPAHADKTQRLLPDPVISGAGQTPATINALLPRPRTPPSDDIEAEFNRDDSRLPDVKGKGGKAKNVNWKDKDDGAKEKEKNGKSDAALESTLGQALTREIRKTEENLHTRIGRLIGKEMDKQHQRLEEARAHEQAEDFARQEKILKLISTELTRNTTRVVEMAVKSEVQNSVLPSLENITKNEVKAALNDQIGKGLLDTISQSLPVEMERLLMRPDITNHFAHVLTSNLTPLIERHVKEAITKTFIPVYSQQSSAMHQELLRELRTEMHNVKSELTAWQGEAFRSHESSIRELEHTVRTLSEQVKFLSMNAPPSLQHLPQQQKVHNSPGPPVSQIQGNVNSSHMRPQNLPPNQPAPTYGHNLPPFQQQPPPMHSQWYGSSIAAPQASHPATIPQPTAPQPQPERTPPIKAEQWDEIYLGVLHSQDSSKLRDLLSRTNPDLVMPLNGTSLVSQAVILTLLHRLSAVVGDTAPNDETFKTSLWWLQRAVAVLRPEDKLITDFIPRVVPNVQHLLNTTKQRLTLLPGGPSTIETVRTLSDIQETLRRKVSAI
ncbi:hypothetical protein BDQ12DRAFT_676749 [Crucibulum laeve]|uniref:Enhancer of mRNA-decapping protein 4 WD40 repeat region domain-containing protein n=1 Tax=Crucibulum laeve TaxID=68775 RepID=A0A5C3MBE2_9AGAR|nr:hypothetical protein BDQ12DRAFT_676749 [Crucibulum laeve]